MHDPSFSHSRRLSGCLMNLQPFTSPDALDPVQADTPAILPRQPVDAAIPVTTIPAGKADDGLSGVGSATAFFTRPLSRSGSFSRCAWFTSMPPYMRRHQQQLCSDTQRLRQTSPTVAPRPSRTSASHSIPIIRSGEQFFLRLIFVSRDVQMKPDPLNRHSPIRTPFRSCRRCLRTDQSPWAGCVVVRASGS